MIRFKKSLMYILVIQCSLSCGDKDSENSAPVITTDTTPECTVTDASLVMQQSISGYSFDLLNSFQVHGDQIWVGGCLSQDDVDCKNVASSTGWDFPGFVKAYDLTGKLLSELNIGDIDEPETGYRTEVRSINFDRDGLPLIAGHYSHQPDLGEDFPIPGDVGAVINPMFTKLAIDNSSNWTRSFIGGQNSKNNGFATLPRSEGGYFLIGDFNPYITLDATQEIALGVRQLFVAKVDDTGQTVESYVVSSVPTGFTGTQQITLSEVILDHAGGFYITGTIDGSITVGDVTIALESDTTSYPAIIHFDKEGDPLWGKGFDALYYDYDFAADQDGNALVLVRLNGAKENDPDLFVLDKTDGTTLQSFNTGQIAGAVGVIGTTVVVAGPVQRDLTICAETIHGALDDNKLLLQGFDLDTGTAKWGKIIFTGRGVEIDYIGVSQSNTIHLAGTFSDQIRWDVGGTPVNSAEIESPNGGNSIFFMAVE